MSEVCHIVAVEMMIVCVLAHVEGCSDGQGFKKFPLFAMNLYCLMVCRMMCCRRSHFVAVFVVELSLLMIDLTHASFI